MDNQRSSDRRALVAVAAQFFMNGALFASFIPRLPEVRDNVGISTAGVGVLLSIAGAGGLLGSAVVGRTIERFGTRRTIMGGGVILAWSLPLIGFASSSFVLLMGLIAMASFDVLVDVAMNMQGSWLSGRRRIPVMNRLHGLWSFG
ncbi:MAG: MFS transporter, partial [Acidimicrobiales bacterium]